MAETVIDDARKVNTLGVTTTDYGYHAFGHRNLIEVSLPLAKEAVGKLPLLLQLPYIIIADYGAADGSATLDLFKQVLTWLRERFGREVPIMLCYEDQLGNDYNSLFHWVHGKKADLSLSSQFENVYITASATEFYSQCFPSNFLSFAFSGLSLHWLSSCPSPLKRDIIASFSFNDFSNEERLKYMEQAARDWQQFLLMRAKELVPGGQMVTSFIATDPTKLDDDQHSNAGLYLLYMKKLWQSFMSDNKITEDEFYSTNLPIYIRTPQEIRAPFDDEESDIVRAGLRLIRITDVTVMSPLLVKADEVLLIDSPDLLRSLGDRAAKLIRAWSYKTFYSCLSEQRTEDEKSNILNDYYNALSEVLVSSLGSHCYDIPIIAVHFEKRKS